MAHLRCPTFSSLNTHIPNLSRLTLASHNKTSRSPSLSPLNSIGFSHSLLPKTRPDDNDAFQSNARSQSRTTKTRPGLHLAGLGISYARPPTYIKTEYNEDIYKALSQPIARPISQVQCGLGDDPSRLQEGTSYLNESPQIIAASWKSSSYDLEATTEPVNHVPFWESDEILNPQDDYSHLRESLVPVSWSSSSSGVAANAVSHTSPLCEELPWQYPKPASGINFSSMVTASGMSVDLFTSQLSATADLALQYMADDVSAVGFASPGTSGSRGSLLEELFDFDDHHISWPAPMSSNVNENLRMDMTTEPPRNVNPTEIMTGVYYRSDVPREEHTEHPSTPDIVFGPMENIHTPQDSIEYNLRLFLPIPGEGDTTSERNDNHAVSPDLKSTYYDFRLPQPAKPTKIEYDHSEYELAQDDQSSSSPFPSPRKRRRIIALKRKGTKKPSKQKIQLVFETFPVPVNIHTPVLELDLGTPVLNAHWGITLDDLKAKAARYRMRNPQRTYDNTWLISFVGRLSRQGELLDKFRCYIDGCSQTNKRRDHILIHVGSHLDHRPFACAFWLVLSLSVSERKLKKLKPLAVPS
ncbi:hypothetical protein H0H81_007783 [Sphagnurus paluster]|uniref:C2H2-type domain-containing protein n=1 Tax=Sphagnurus paluster TaxID=117069 RepID=A0A9P7GWB3_9AGAR|nr:hypothetical protein H0H81_007783 [Sphagnurus paluster]